MKTLKEATKAKHNQAENTPFNKRMLKGQLTESEYLNYLVQQLSIFKTIESIGLPSPKLSRIKPLESDIYELKQKVNIEFKPLESTNSYVKHLKKLDYDAILPHIYLNYLALLYGGQYIRKVVPSTGMFYKFDSNREAMESIRSIEKDEWAYEANIGFDFLIEMFNELEHDKS